MLFFFTLGGDVYSICQQFIRISFFIPFIRQKMILQPNHFTMLSYTTNLNLRCLGLRSKHISKSRLIGIHILGVDETIEIINIFKDHSCLFQS